MLGTQHAMVVHGDGGSAHGQVGIDEIALSGPTQIAEVRNGVVTHYTIAPEDFGLRRAPLESLTGGNAALNAAILTAIFAGEPGPRRDVVLLNAAAVLVTAGAVNDIPEGIVAAAAAIDSGAAARLVASLRVH